MGNCNSADSTAVPTAKLVLQDGKLEEFAYPVKVAQVLHSINNNSNNEECFICNADNIDFNNIVRAVNVEEELQPGQLYFALPLRRLRCPMQAEEMAALAVKASSALRNCSIRSGGDNGTSRWGEMIKSGGVASNAGLMRRREVVPVVFSGEERSGGGAGGAGRRRRRRKSGGRGNEFISELSVIEE